jgi:Uncharacterized protein conserved in bacteria (DUF2066)
MRSMLASFAQAVGAATRNSRRAGLGLAIAAALLAGTGGGAGAAEEVFTVANFPLEARADNAVAAKERALAEGQQAALRSLLKRLASVSAYSRIARLRNVKAGDLLAGVSVRSERNSSTEYIANLDFSFQSKPVRDLLRREGIPFTDESAPVLIVIPVGRAVPAAKAKTEARWTDAWKSLDLEHALTPIRLEGLRQEISPESLNALADGDGSALRALVANYGSELILLALAERDAGAKRLTVTLAGRDAVGAFALRRIYHIDPTDPGYASDLAAVVSLGILEGRWKAIKIHGAVAAGGADLLIAVEFRGMNQWQDISRRLAATPGVEELEVAGLSARGARVTLRFAEGPELLAEALARQGLTLRNADGNWMLSLQ